jgi:integrase/recombinase XerD
VLKILSFALAFFGRLQIKAKNERINAEKTRFRWWKLEMQITDHMEADEVHHLLDTAAACNQRDYLMLRLLWRTGVRVNELLNVKPSDVEQRNNVINVTKAKGGKQRRVPLDAATIQMLSDYVLASNIGKDQPIFGIRQRWAREIVRRYGARVGRHGLHPHTFRHSFAIHCVRNGWDIRRLQQVLGHSSMATTAVYLQFNDRDIRELYDKTTF